MIESDPLLEQIHGDFPPQQDVMVGKYRCRRMQRGQYGQPNGDIMMLDPDDLDCLVHCLPATYMTRTQVEAFIDGFSVGRDAGITEGVERVRGAIRKAMGIDQE